MAESVADVKSGRRVMIAIDENDCSRYALEWTLENLHENLAASSPLIIYTVQPLTNLIYIPAASYGSAPPELIQSMQEHQKKISLTLLERAKSICAKSGVVTEALTEVGDPKESICKAVEKLNISLLIMGTHGRGALQRFKDPLFQ